MEVCKLLDFNGKLNVVISVPEGGDEILKALEGKAKSESATKSITKATAR
ncbi:hypothetical protein [Pseudobutyrivibrio ruminis]|nr:hypothetical protein [Pseudobutyrivibrio ruminis]